jgi:hypothetical protein
VTDIPQPAGVRTAKYEVSDVHTPLTSNDYHMKEVLKKISPLPEDKQHKLLSRKLGSSKSDTVEFL